jgi:hypothetical protein
MNEKLGWVNNRILFKGLKHDPHNVSIKIGERMELICREVAQIKYGKDVVPFYVRGEGVTEEEAQEYFEEQYPRSSYEKNNFIHILTKYDVDSLCRILPSPYFILKEYGKIDRRVLRKLYNKYSPCLEITNKISHVATDLIIRKNKKIGLYEMKITGNVDSRKAPTCITKMLISYLILNKKNAGIYFCVLSSNQKNQKCPPSILKYLDEELVLVEDDFWNVIMPPGVSIDQFKGFVEKRFDTLKRKATGLKSSRLRRAAKK